jgi:hypothetical protein
LKAPKKTPASKTLRGDRVMIMQSSPWWWPRAFQPIS